MSANNRVGSKRLVVGAHYGLRDWLAQRITAVIMAVWSLTRMRYSPGNGVAQSTQTAAPSGFGV